MSVQRRERAGKVRWVARYRDPAGRERSRTFDTRREGTAWLDERRREMRRGEWVAPEDQAITVGELVTEWVAQASRESTGVNRGGLAKNLGDLEAMPVGKVRASHIEAWVAVLIAGRPWKDREKLATSTVSVMLGQLLTVLTRARRDGLITVAPEPQVVLSTDRVVRRADLLSPADVRAMITAAHTAMPNSPARPWLARFLFVAAGTGLRVSELCGLRVKDVDFLGRQIHVRWQADPRGRKLIELKTPSSERTVPVPQAVIDTIAEQLAEVPRARDESVWSRDDGGMRGRAAVSETLRRMIRRQGLREASMHDLRHYYASALIAAGVPVTGVQAALGHASAVTTLAIYAHLFEGAEDVTRTAAAAALVAVRDQCGTEPADGAAATGSGSR